MADIADEPRPADFFLSRAQPMRPAMNEGIAGLRSASVTDLGKQLGCYGGSPAWPLLAYHHGNDAPARRGSYRSPARRSCRLRIDDLAAEAIAKLLRVVALSETEDEDVGVAAAE